MGSWVSSRADVHDRRKQQKRNWKACGHRPNKAVNHTWLWLYLYHTWRATHHLSHYFMTSKTNLQGYLCLLGRQMYSNDSELHEMSEMQVWKRKKTLVFHSFYWFSSLLLQFILSSTVTVCKLNWILNWWIYHRIQHLTNTFWNVVFWPSGPPYFEKYNKISWTVIRIYDGREGEKTKTFQKTHFLTNVSWSVCVLIPKGHRTQKCSHGLYQ